MPELISSSIIGDREKFLLYGDPKMGKTFCALTLPEPIYFLAVGGSNEAKTYFSAQFQKKHGKKEIYLDSAQEEIDKRGRFKSAVGFDRICTLLDKALELDEKGEKTFNSIIVDNATVLSEYQMNKVMEISNAGGRPEGAKDTAYEKYQAHGIVTPFDSDWGASQSLMSKFVSWIFALDKNVVFIAHEWEQTVSNRKTHSQDIVGVKPLFVGKQRDRIANMFDNVWRFSKSGQFYSARTVPQDKPFSIIAGSRIGGIVDDDYENPDLTDTIKRFQKHAAQFDQVA